MAFEVKETATKSDLVLTNKLANNIGITNCFVICKNPPRNLERTIWGGSIK